MLSEYEFSPELSIALSTSCNALYNVSQLFLRCRALGVKHSGLRTVACFRPTYNMFRSPLLLPDTSLAQIYKLHATRADISEWIFLKDRCIGVDRELIVFLLHNELMQSSSRNHVPGSSSSDLRKSLIASSKSPFRPLAIPRRL